MPSFLHRFAGLSCRNVSAVDVEMEKNMLDTFSGRQVPPQTKVDIVATAPLKPSLSVSSQQPSPSPPSPPPPPAKILYRGNSIRSCRSINTTTKSRRNSLRSTFSRCDSYTSTISGITVRSSPWYMKNMMSPSVMFWNDNEDRSVHNNNNRSSHHRRVSTSVPIIEDHEENLAVTDHEETSEEDSEEEEIIFSEISDDDDDDEQNSSNDDCLNTTSTPFQLSSLLGSTIVRNDVNGTTRTSTEYDTDKEFHDKTALVGIYYVKAAQCQQTTDYVNLFTAGYYHEKSEDGIQALSIIYCNADDDDEDDSALPTIVPLYWYSFPNSSDMKEIKNKIRHGLDIVDTAGPTLVIIDPISGAIVRSNAILDIIHLNRSDTDLYDTEACQLYESWLRQLSSTLSLQQQQLQNTRTTSIRYELMDVNDEVTIQYMDGKLNAYKRSLPYSI